MKEPETMEVLTMCPKCQDTKAFDLDYDDYLRWQTGELIQKIFPNISAEDRERLITGICPKCWDEMFKEDEYEMPASD